jgi:hypothetical protein
MKNRSDKIILGAAAAFIVAGVIASGFCILSEEKLSQKDDHYPVLASPANSEADQPEVKDADAKSERPPDAAKEKGDTDTNENAAQK